MHFLTGTKTGSDGFRPRRAPSHFPGGWEKERLRISAGTFWKKQGCFFFREPSIRGIFNISASVSAGKTLPNALIGSKPTWTNGKETDHSLLSNISSLSAAIRMECFELSAISKIRSKFQFTVTNKVIFFDIEIFTARSARDAENAEK